MCTWHSRSVRIVHIVANQEHSDCAVPRTVLVQDRTGMELCNVNCACAFHFNSTKKDHKILTQKSSTLRWYIYIYTVKPANLTSSGRYRRRQSGTRGGGRSWSGLLLHRVSLFEQERKKLIRNRARHHIARGETHRGMEIGGGDREGRGRGGGRGALDRWSRMTRRRRRRGEGLGGRGGMMAKEGVHHFTP